MREEAGARGPDQPTCYMDGCVAVEHANGNTTKLGATLITCTRSNQRLISNAKTKEPRATGSCGMKLCIARATSVHVPRARAKSACRVAMPSGRCAGICGRHERSCRHEVARNASRSRRGIGFRRGRVRRVEGRLAAPISRSLVVVVVAGVVNARTR